MAIISLVKVVAAAAIIMAVNKEARGDVMKVDLVGDGGGGGDGGGEGLKTFVQLWSMYGRNQVVLPS